MAVTCGDRSPQVTCGGSEIIRDFSGRLGLPQVTAHAGTALLPPFKGEVQVAILKAWLANVDVSALEACPLPDQLLPGWVYLLPSPNRDVNPLDLNVNLRPYWALKSKNIVHRWSSGATTWSYQAKGGSDVLRVILFNQADFRWTEQLRWPTYPELSGWLLLFCRTGTAEPDPEAPPTGHVPEVIPGSQRAILQALYVLQGDIREIKSELRLIRSLLEKRPFSNDIPPFQDLQSAFDELAAVDLFPDLLDEHPAKRGRSEV